MWALTAAPCSLYWAGGMTLFLIAINHALTTLAKVVFSTKIVHGLLNDSGLIQITQQSFFMFLAGTILLWFTCLVGKFKRVLKKVMEIQDIYFSLIAIAKSSCNFPNFARGVLPVNWQSGTRYFRWFIVTTTGFVFSWIILLTTKEVTSFLHVLFIGGSALVLTPARRDRLSDTSPHLHLHTTNSWFRTVSHNNTTSSTLTQPSATSLRFHSNTHQWWLTNMLRRDHSDTHSLTPLWIFLLNLLCFMICAWSWVTLDYGLMICLTSFLGCKLHRLKCGPG